jgi:hypothetical protein
LKETPERACQVLTNPGSEPESSSFPLFASVQNWNTKKSEETKGDLLEFEPPFGIDKLKLELQQSFLAEGHG